MTGAVRIREAVRADAAEIARIGTAAMPAQYDGLVDPSAVRAAVAQTYAVDAVADCIELCSKAGDAHFLVAATASAVVGYLHFDSFGPEPELHRLYVEDRARAAGTGSLLIEALHDRLAPPGRYMLLVLEGNDRAVAFYKRHGLQVAEHVDGLAYYSEHMGVDFPSSTQPFVLVLMRRG